MGGFEIKFNVYATSQEEADMATDAIKAFIGAKAQQGIAVTAGDTIAAPTNLRDCCSITNAESIVGSFNLATA